VAAVPALAIGLAFGGHVPAGTRLTVSEQDRGLGGRCPAVAILAGANWRRGSQDHSRAHVRVARPSKLTRCFVQP
jgi:hypothetical protein